MPEASGHELLGMQHGSFLENFSETWHLWICPWVGENLKLAVLAGGKVGKICPRLWDGKRGQMLDMPQDLDMAKS